MRKKPEESINIDESSVAKVHAILEAVIANISSDMDFSLELRTNRGNTFFRRKVGFSPICTLQAISRLTSLTLQTTDLASYKFNESIVHYIGKRVTLRLAEFYVGDYLGFRDVPVTKTILICFAAFFPAKLTRCSTLDLSGSLYFRYYRMPVEDYFTVKKYLHLYQKRSRFSYTFTEDKNRIIYYDRLRIANSTSYESIASWVRDSSRTDEVTQMLKARHQ